MPIGWIDFSKDERNKVLNVIHLLDEPGAVDELGIGAVRDAFADLFSQEHQQSRHAQSTSLLFRMSLWKQAASSMVLI